MFLLCLVFAMSVRVCSYVLCGHLLGKGWPLGSRLWCLLWVCHFPIGILGQVWYLIVSIPDLCTFTYFPVDLRLLQFCDSSSRRIKMQCLPSIFSLFRNEFNKFNNTRARMLDSIYQKTLRLLWHLISAVKRYNFAIMYATMLWTS